jgi:transposase-like protein
VAKKRSIWHNRAKYFFTFKIVNKSYVKTCTVCHSIFVKKDGFKYGRQRYKCKTCGHVFQNKSRKKQGLKKQAKELWGRYSHRKQTYKELSSEFHTSVRNIQKILDTYDFIPPHVTPRKIVLIMDTTYF